MLEVLNNSILGHSFYSLALYIFIICNMWVPVFLSVADFFYTVLVLEFTALVTYSSMPLAIISWKLLTLNLF